jgi:hypothetical protein
MKPSPLMLLTIFAAVLSSCGPGSLQATIAAQNAATSPAPTVTPSDTPAPSDTPVPTRTPVLATSTPIPQPLLLRRPCGRDYVVRADEPVEIYYGGFGSKGKELAEQWATALTVELTIDGEVIPSEAHAPAPDLPYNCADDYEDSYWIYFTAAIPSLSAGRHDVTVTFNALRPLSDGYGTNYLPGQLATQTFRITAQ